jgi:hypothetical protein
MQGEEQGPELQRNLWQLAASFLSLLVAIALSVLAFAGVIPTAALLLALVFVVLALSIGGVI